jgi:ArsR family transcriptional regulator, virulence genes transcriptional regulator
MINETYADYARFLKAMAQPRRLEIIHLLRSQELCVGDIYAMLDFPQANISQHLLKLRVAGIVKTRRQGKQIYYRLSDPRLIEASDLFVSLLGSPLPNLQQLGPLVHDPVCGMQLSPKTSPFHFRHSNSDYYFCASGCLKKFKHMHRI